MNIEAIKNRRVINKKKQRRKADYKLEVNPWQLNKRVLSSLISELGVNDLML